MHVTPIINHENCSGCGDCVAACPNDALEIVDQKVVIVRPDDCDYCADCEPLCPEGAIACAFEIAFADD